VYEPIEDQQDPIDTRGLLYANAVSRPGDAEDWLQFSIVPGEVDPTIRFGLDCDISDEDPQPLRATLYDEDFNVVELIVCGEETANVTLTGASSTANQNRMEIGS
jgi:hypothetical protein